MAGTEKVLFVDDDERLLQSLARRFRSHFEIETALGPTLALAHMRDNGPPAIVVSDYQMPEMHGVAFLKHVQKHYPDTVRIMLTGQADLEVAMTAVNEGAIFRFLTKPCGGETLCRAVADGMELGQLRRAEKLLLEKTLTGSVAVLCDVLSLSNPAAFGRASRLRSVVKQVLARLPLSQPWKIESAAMLSQIGWISLPPDLLAKVQTGRDITPEETLALARLPEIAAELLEKVPRLDAVARLISAQSGATNNLDDEEVLGVKILAVAQVVEMGLSAGKTIQAAVQAALAGAPNTPPTVAQAFRALRDSTKVAGQRTVPINRAPAGAVVVHDIVSRDGTKLLGRGQVLSAGALARLRTYVQLGRLDDSIAIESAESNEEAAA